METFSAEKIASLGLDLQIKGQLEGIIRRYRAQADADRNKMRIEQLETAIKRQPRNTALYHELYELYQEEKNVKDSKDLIQKLVKNNPDDMRGRFLLGKDEFSQNHFLAAQNQFDRILAANEKSDVNRELILKSIIYFPSVFTVCKKEKTPRNLSSTSMTQPLKQKSREW